MYPTLHITDSKLYKATCYRTTPDILGIARGIKEHIAIETAPIEVSQGGALPHEANQRNCNEDGPEGTESPNPTLKVMWLSRGTLGEVGPGSTIVLAASESFSTALRGHGVGLAAAWSKAGAAIGTQVFKPILASWGDDEYHGTQAAFLIGSGFAVLGGLLA
jgi:hypothetical protein